MGLAKRLSAHSLTTETVAHLLNSSITHDRCTLVKHRVPTKRVALTNQLEREHSLQGRTRYG